MRSFFYTLLGILGAFCILALLHAPLLKLPYFWDEAGYYVPAALDFYRHAFLIPRSTLATGHTPLVTIYLGLAWRPFGFSPLVTRAAMILVAAATVVALWKLARRVAPANSEAAAWSVALLAASPLFFAQSSLAHLDLAAALFTTLAVAALLRRSTLIFAIVASLAVLSKETAVVLLPAAWILAAWRWRERRTTAWLLLAAPLLPLVAWTIYYHYTTGFWTGNADYLQYNLYSTLRPLRILFSLARRLYEVFIAGFNWLLAAAAAFGFWWKHREESQKANGKWQMAKVVPGGEFRVSNFEFSTGADTSPEARTANSELRTPAPGPRPPAPDLRQPTTANRPPISDFFFLTAAVTAVYLAMLSVVGGAVLPRYLLPIFPVLYLAAVVLVLRLPHLLARALLAVVLVCFVAAWFINPPYPFPFEDNLAYADFIHLHQQAARFLENRPDAPRILTAWPASDELRQPYLGYVTKPLRVVPVEGFTGGDFAPVDPESFDLLLLYSRKWEPPGNWLARFRLLKKMQRRYFDYAPQEDEKALVARFHLTLAERFERRGQWVAIYVRRLKWDGSREANPLPSQKVLDRE